VINSILCSIITIAMYEFFFMLKRVETQINPKYENINDVLTQLKRQIRIQRFLIFLNISSDITILSIFISDNHIL